MSKRESPSAIYEVFDTFWRMLVPPALLVTAGIWLDDKTGHEHLFVLVGLALGFVAAGLMVWAQYRRNN